MTMNLNVARAFPGFISNACISLGKLCCNDISTCEGMANILAIGYSRVGLNVILDI